MGRPRRSRRWRHLGALVAVAVAATGCGVSNDTAPRDIIDERADGPDDSAGPAAVGTEQIFLVVPNASGSPSRLVPVSRDVGSAEGLDPTSVLDVLFAGPNDRERSADVISLVPAGVELLGWGARTGGEVTIDLSAPFATLTGDALVFALAQVVYTVSELSGVRGVRITVDGEASPWPDVNGQLQSDALTVFDYPGLVRTTQPAFPAVPSE